MTKSVRTVLVGVAVLLALASTGCSGGSSGGSAQNSQSTAREQAHQFTVCMRNNGIGDMPDLAGPGFFPAETTGDPKFDGALAKCRKHLPHNGELRKPTAEERVQQLAYAKCMRENGIPYYPDPKPGELKPFQSDSAGRDRFDNDPKGPAAATKCQSRTGR